MATKTCEICGASFEALGKHKTCGAACSAELRKRTCAADYARRKADPDWVAKKIAAVVARKQARAAEDPDFRRKTSEYNAAYYLKRKHP